MTKCAGCGLTADLYCKHNESIKLCTPCHKLMWQIEVRTISNQRYPRCFCCDSPIFHGGIVCPLCNHDAMNWLYNAVGLELMHDNPLVYRLALPAIRFAQYMKFSNPSAAEGWYRFYPTGGPNPDDEGPPHMVTVSFERLVYGEENTA